MAPLFKSFFLGGKVPPMSEFDDGANAEVRLSSLMVEILRCHPRHPDTHYSLLTTHYPLPHYEASPREPPAPKRAPT
jgi:hypothetical protein